MNKIIILIVAISLMAGCASSEKTDNTSTSVTGSLESLAVQISGIEFPLTTDSAAVIPFTLEVPESGRYQVSISASNVSQPMVVRVEDHTDNQDGRFYDVTGGLLFTEAGEKVKDGSPLRAGTHQMNLHVDQASTIGNLGFELMVAHQETPITLTQNMEGDEWELTWSDEFDGEVVDSSKWTYDVGDWGWGNNELQYYTVADPNNARIEDGSLVIEARKDAETGKWTSARLTTRGKETFLYGKIEFRALVPRERGNWAAGWTLGDSYVDEKSWPYCGEIDILESVGYEVDDESGDGIAHVTVHTPAYYFKINNQISNTKDIVDIAEEYHTYSVVWTPTEVQGFVDGTQYYTYDKIADEREWPFAEPQNIILNLAMGGGWGGAQGMDTTITSQKFLIDYVRVFQKN